MLLGPIQAQTTDDLVTYWIDAGRFPNRSSVLAVIKWVGSSHIDLVHFFWRPGWLTTFLVILGGAHLWRTGRRSEFLLLILPVAMGLAAAFLHRWPFGERLMAFAAPVVLMLAAVGLERLRLRLAFFHPLLGWIFVAAILLPGMVNAAFHMAYPRVRHEFRPVMQYVTRHQRPDDHFSVFAPAEVEFYTGRDFRKGSLEAASSARVWFIATRKGYQKEFPSPAQDLLDRLIARRPRLAAVEEFGAAAYLFGPEPMAAK